jgi:hypothetical protein
MKDLLIDLSNVTSTLKGEGAFASFGKDPVLYGRGNGRELGLYNLCFAGSAAKLSKTITLLNDNADLLKKISDNGRDPLDYDPNNLRKKG